MGRTLHGLPVLVGRGPLGEEDADPAGVVRGQRRIGREVILPGGARVEGLLAEFVGADPADPVQARDADLVHELRQLLGDGGRDAVALASRWLVEETGPDAGQAGAVLQLFPAVDALALELVQTALERLRRQEDDRLDARERPCAELLRRLLELGLELLRLLVGEVQRVLDGPGRVAVAELPGRAVVGRYAWVGLDLDEEQAAGGRDEQVDLADVPAGGGEREGLPGPIRLGFRHVALDVLQG